MEKNRNQNWLLKLNCVVQVFFFVPFQFQLIFVLTSEEAPLKCYIDVLLTGKPVRLVGNPAVGQTVCRQQSLERAARLTFLSTAIHHQQCYKVSSMQMQESYLPSKAKIFVELLLLNAAVFQDGGLQRAAKN